jgi:hypothetical protein
MEESLEAMVVSYLFEELKRVELFSLRPELSQSEVN